MTSGFIWLTLVANKSEPRERVLLAIGHIEVVEPFGTSRSIIRTRSGHMIAVAATVDDIAETIASVLREEADEAL